MANSYQAVLPQFMASFLTIMRDQTLISRLVNRDYADTPAGTGENVSVTLPSTYTARNRTPGAASTQAEGTAPRKANIPLDQWVYVDMDITDTQWGAIQRGVVTPQIGAMAEALANKVNGGLLDSVRTKLGTTSGSTTAGPFATDERPYLGALQALDERNVPKGNRFAVVRPVDYYDALRVPNLVQADRRGDGQALVTGQLGILHGAPLFMSNLIARQATAAPGAGAITVSGPTAVGSQSVTLSKGAGDTMAFKRGDVIKFAGHAQTYVVTADATLAGGVSVGLTISPALVAPLAAGEAVTVTAAHSCNLVAHRDAIYLASRRLEDFQGAANTFAMPDDVTGLTYRAEIERQNGQTKLTVDVLFGVDVVRPELGVRLLAPAN